LRERFKTNRDKEDVDFIVPVMGTCPKAVEGAEKKPVFVRAGVRISGRRANNHDLVLGKKALTEWVFAIALMQWMIGSHSKTDNEMERITTKDGSIPINLAPDTVFVIAQDDNMWLSTK
jgi:hypothetical protein